METTVGSGADFVNPNPLIRDGIYAQSQVVRLLGISDRTLNRWEQAGLRPLQPGTTLVFYEGRNIIEVMRIADADLPQYKAKRDQKKGK
jgi:hypothetical protein